MDNKMFALFLKLKVCSCSLFALLCVSFHPLSCWASVVWLPTLPLKNTQHRRGTCRIFILSRCDRTLEMWTAHCTGGKSMLKAWGAHASSSSTTCFYSQAWRLLHVMLKLFVSLSSALHTQRHIALREIQLSVCLSLSSVNWSNSIEGRVQETRDSSIHSLGPASALLYTVISGG